MRKNFNNRELNGECADVSLVEIPHSCIRCSPGSDHAFDRSVFQAALAEPPAPLNCADGFVGPGVTVNESAILGAEVIVLKDLKPWMIVMENTARD